MDGITCDYKNVIFEKTMKYAKEPKKSHENDVGYDCFCPHEEFPVPPGEIAVMNLGFKLQIQNDNWIGVHSKSGLAAKNGIMILNCPGVIDPNYREEVMAIIFNAGNTIKTFYRGDKVCQLIIYPRIGIIFQDGVVDSTERTGGLGSTGK